MLRDYANSKHAFGSLMSVGPEIFAYATSDNYFKRNVVNTSIGGTIASMLLQALSDQNPDSIDPDAL